MEQKNIRGPRGMRDILPNDAKKREFVLDVIKKTYSSFGFTQIETPALELIERIKSSEGGENENLVYQILRRGLNKNEPVLPIAPDAVDLGLRYDLTLPLSRFYATNYSVLPKVFKSIQIGSVWRAERPQKGRYRQFTQCDIDIIGESGLIAESELIIATLKTLQNLGLNNLTISLSDRNIATDILSEYFENDKAKIQKALIIIDKLDKIGSDAVKEALSSEFDFSQKKANEVLKKIMEFDFQESNNLQEIISIVQKQIPNVNFKLDASLMRGMGYYTGSIFEIKLDGLYSIAGGGRYDNMIGKWLNSRQVPACGFSIGFERIVDLVDSDNLKTVLVKKLALFYKKDEIKGLRDFNELFSLQDKLQKENHNAQVVIIELPKKLTKSYFEELKNNGYTHIYRNNELKYI